MQGNSDCGYDGVLRRRDAVRCVATRISELTKQHVLCIFSVLPSQSDAAVPRVAGCATYVRSHNPRGYGPWNTDVGE